MCATMLVCVSMMPLGRPVVPEEYITRHGSSGLASSARGFGSWAARNASYSSPSAPSGVTSMIFSTFGQPVADLLDHRHQLGADDQHAGAGVVDRVVDLVTGRAPVDDRVGRAERARAARLSSTQAGWFLSRKPTTSPRADAQRGQASGEAAYALVPLRPGPGAPAVGHAVPVGIGLRPPRQPVVHEHGRGCWRCGQGGPPRVVCADCGPGKWQGQGVDARCRITAWTRRRPRV